MDFDIEEVCVYSVVRDGKLEEESFGMLNLAEIRTFEKELHNEIEKIILTDGEVDRWTYPEIQPKLMEKYRKSKCEKDMKEKEQ